MEKHQTFFIFVAGIATMAMTGILYLHNTFASQKDLEALRDLMHFNQESICRMAIKQNYTDAANACYRAREGRRDQ